MLVRDIFTKIKPVRLTPKVEKPVGEGVVPEMRHLSPYMGLRISNLMVGLEIEVEHVDRLLWSKVGPGWSVCKDGSLREGGFEFVTRLGTRLHHIPGYLNDLNEGWAAKATEAEQAAGYGPVIPYFSERTSTHVHLDCRMLGEDNLRSLIMLYTVFERGLFNLCSPNREFNVFAVPLNNIALEDYSSLDLKSMANQWSRYSALNLHALDAYGTVEFRHMHGTADKKVILPWMFMLAHMRVKAGMTSQRDVFKDICAAQRRGDFTDLVSFTFGPWANRITMSNDELYSAASHAKLFYSGE